MKLTIREEDAGVMSESNSCQLPVPPSANRLWRTFRGHNVRSGEYNRWLEVASDLMKRHLVPINGPVDVLIMIFGGKGLMVTSDLDNFIKPVLDALKSPSYDKLGKISKPGSAVIEDDNVRVVKSITCHYIDRLKKSKGAAFCVVSLSAYDEGLRQHKLECLQNVLGMSVERVCK